MSSSWLVDQKIASIAFRVVSAMSIVPAVCICMETMKDRKARVDTTATRTLFCIAVSSILFSVGNVLGSLPIPSFDQDSWGNFGNTTACDMQGFLLVVTTSCVFCFDMLLSFTYLLMVRYNWSDSSLVRMEKTAHMVILLLAVGYATAGLVTESYNSRGDQCWFEPYPKNCLADDSVKCIRGQQANILAFPNFLLGLLAMITSCTCMILIYFAVRHSETRNARYATMLGSRRTMNSVRYLPTTVAEDGRSNSVRAVPTAQAESLPPPRGMLGSSTRSLVSEDITVEIPRHLSRQVGIQGVWYASTLLITALPSMAVNLIWVLTGFWNSYLATGADCLALLHTYAYLMVFMRNRYDCKTKFGRFMRSILVKLCCCCFTERPQQSIAAQRRPRWQHLTHVMSQFMTSNKPEADTSNNTITDTS